MVLFIIAILFVSLSFFCQSPMVRRGLWVATALTVIAASSFVWAEAHLLGGACTGTLVEGLDCPAPSLMTRLALAHLTFGLFALLAGVFIAPTVVILALWLELRFRRRQNAATP